MRIATLLLPALAVGLSASPGGVEARPDATGMTCGQSAGLVRRQGAVVLGTGGFTFDRFVSDRRFCEATEETKPAFVATRDAPSCFVGYRCFEPSRRDGFGWR